MLKKISPSFHVLIIFFSFVVQFSGETEDTFIADLSVGLATVSVDNPPVSEWYLVFLPINLLVELLLLYKHAPLPALASYCFCYVSDEISDWILIQRVAFCIGKVESNYLVMYILWFHHSLISHISTRWIWFLCFKVVLINCTNVSKTLTVISVNHCSCVCILSLLDYL